MLADSGHDNIYSVIEYRTDTDGNLNTILSVICEHGKAANLGANRLRVFNR